MEAELKRELKLEDDTQDNWHLSAATPVNGPSLLPNGLEACNSMMLEVSMISLK